VGFGDWHQKREIYLHKVALVLGFCYGHYVHKTGSTGCAPYTIMEDISQLNLVIVDFSGVDPNRTFHAGPQCPQPHLEHTHPYFTGGYTIGQARINRKQGCLDVVIQGKLSDERRSARTTIAVQLSLAEFEELILGTDQRWFSSNYGQQTVEDFINPKTLLELREIEAKHVAESLMAKLTKAQPQLPAAARRTPRNCFAMPDSLSGGHKKVRTGKTAAK
jgi:hypothetical protein